MHYDKYTGQNTPAAMIGMSASPAPSMQSLPYIYSALPAYLTQGPGHILLPSSNPFDHMSPPHSPYDPYPPSMSMPRPSTADSPPRGSTAGSSQNPQSPRPLHIETQLPHLGQTQSQSQGQSQSHPAHPGPITLPPPPQAFPAPMSPQSTQVPPITPSMPSFSFVPQAPTPPLHAQFLSPGIGPFSPTMSPGGFYSPVGPHPFLNPAPGAPVHLQHVGMHSLPHSPVSPHPPSSPGAVGPFFMYHHAAEGYFPPVGMHVVGAMPVHPHPLAQEHTPPSDAADDAVTVSHRTMVEESVLRRPMQSQQSRSNHASPASVLTASEEGSGSKVGTSSPGTSLDGEPPLAPRPAAVHHAASDPAAVLHMDLPRAKSTGTRGTPSLAQAGPIERPSHAYSSSVASVAQLENGLAALELGQAVGTPNRDRRASWHVDSPSVENPRGGGSYFAAAFYGN